MSSSRTRISIVEWAARARRARALEIRLADAFGEFVGVVDDPAAKLVLARQARHHAFHAELWDGVVPVLHDVVVSDDPSDDPHLARVAGALTEAAGLPDVASQLGRVFGTAIPALVASYQDWAADTSVVADRPVMRVLDLVLRDDEFDLHEGELLTGAD